MKSLFLSVVMVLTVSVSAQAKQLELPLQHPDEVLAAASYDSPNIQLVPYSQMPKMAQDTHQSIDLAFEAGDGYYNQVQLVYYRVLDANLKTVGYMQVALLAYTEDPDYVVVGAWVNNAGRRLDKEIWLTSMDRGDMVAIGQLPEELRPNDGEE